MNDDPLIRWLVDGGDRLAETPALAAADLRRLGELVETEPRYALMLARKHITREPQFADVGLGIRDLCDSIRRRFGEFGSAAGQRATIAVLDAVLLALAEGSRALPAPLRRALLDGQQGDADQGDGSLDDGPEGARQRLDALHRRLLDDFRLDPDEQWQMLAALLDDVAATGELTGPARRIVLHLVAALVDDLTADAPGAACRLLLAATSRGATALGELRQQYGSGGMLHPHAWRWLTARIAARDPHVLAEEWTSLPLDLHRSERIREGLAELGFAAVPADDDEHLDRLARASDRWHRLSLRWQRRGGAQAQRAALALERAAGHASTDTADRRSAHVRTWLPLGDADLPKPVAACLCADVASWATQASPAGRVLLGGLLGAWQIEPSSHGCAVQPLQLAPSTTAEILGAFAEDDRSAFQGGWRDLPREVLRLVLLAGPELRARLLDGADAAASFTQDLHGLVEQRCGDRPDWLRDTVTRVLIGTSAASDAHRAIALDRVLEPSGTIDAQDRRFVLEVARIDDDPHTASDLAAECAELLTTALAEQDQPPPNAAHAIRSVQRRIARGLDAGADDADVDAFLALDLEHFLTAAATEDEPVAPPSTSPAGSLSAAARTRRRISQLLTLAILAVAAHRYALPAMVDAVDGPSRPAGDTARDRIDAAGWLRRELGPGAGALQAVEGGQTAMQGVAAWRLDPVPGALWSGDPATGQPPARATRDAAHDFTAQLERHLEDAWPGAADVRELIAVELDESPWIATRPTRELIRCVIRIPEQVR